ncbi:MAG: helix-turn-helix domain-containing protein [Candidatus Thorarchaeota archaeon]
MEEEPFTGYPLDDEFLDRIISDGTEGPLLDFKQKLNISNPRSKREFIRDMISLANVAAYCQKLAYLIIGVDENRDIHDVSATLCDDATYQGIINSYVEPPIDFLLRKKKRNGKTIGVFVIKPSDSIHCTKRAIYGANGQKILEKGRTWRRRGSRKFELAGKELENSINEIRISKQLEVIKDDVFFARELQPEEDSSSNLAQTREEIAAIMRKLLQKQIQEYNVQGEVIWEGNSHLWPFSISFCTDSMNGIQKSKGIIRKE